MARQVRIEDEPGLVIGAGCNRAAVLLDGHDGASVWRDEHSAKRQQQGEGR
jgi:hypothetical protein